VRVISGSARGKKLLPVPGMATRPTTDRVKESVFNILQFKVYQARVLDLFAGTGQMGIEALSRGASRCVFVDQATAAIRVIEKNVQAAQVGDRAKIMQTDYASFLSGCGEKFDILFLDPPYGGKVLNHALKIVEKFDILDSDGIIICESNVEDEIIVPESFSVQKTYRYGTIQLMKLDRG
jgi:16S rRNA (guanine966-N2)-methyltransferase